MAPVSGISRTGASNSSASIRVFEENNTTSDFTDNCFQFIDYVSGPASVKNKSYFPLQQIIVWNDGTADVEVSFDASTVHSIVGPGEKAEWQGRYESLMAVRSPPDKTARFRLEAW